MMRILSLLAASFVLLSFDRNDVYTEPKPETKIATPTMPWDCPVPLAQLSAPEQDDGRYMGFKGRWVEVCATAYTPTNPIDSDYHATKGKWRWKTADGVTDVRKVPYGIAVPLQRRSDKKIPVWPFGTRVIIPTGYGYLDRMRPDNRVFKVEDTSESSKFFYSKQGKLHIDVRFVDYDDAIKWAGPLGYRFIKIFVIEEE